jgi:hypothetical protein
MGNGDYINKLLNGVRGDQAQVTNEALELVEHQEITPVEKENLELMELLERIRNFEVRGKAQRLIRIDQRTEEVLKQVKSTLKIDVTTFVNFLCWEFLENNPELINKIKESLKS